jgi:hypothetical protein
MALVEFIGGPNCGVVMEVVHASTMYVFPAPPPPFRWDVEGEDAPRDVLIERILYHRIDEGVRRPIRYLYEPIYQSLRKNAP